jgi:hypothetical protein
MRPYTSGYRRRVMIKLLIMEISTFPPYPMSVHADPRIASAFSEGLFRAGSSLYASI